MHPRYVDFNSSFQHVMLISKLQKHKKPVIVLHAPVGTMYPILYNVAMRVQRVVQITATIMANARCSLTSGDAAVEMDGRATPVRKLWRCCVEMALTMIKVHLIIALVNFEIFLIRCKD